MTFDLEKARATYSAGCAEDAANLVPDLIAEIERLRAELAKVNQAREAEIDQAGAAERIYLEGVRAKDARIQELEEALVEERGKVLCDDPDQLLDWWSVCKHDNYLEDARLQLQAEGKIGPDTEPANIQALQRVMRKQHDHPAEMVELNADHQYQPEAPRSWQITDERKAALETAEFAVSHLAGCYPDCERILGKPDQRVAKVLRAMLEEVGQ